MVTRVTKTKRIRVSIETHEALAARGRKGESFDAVIRRMLDEWDWVDTLKGHNPIRDLPDVEEEVRER